MADFTPTQGRYLSFIDAFTKYHGYPPSETEIATAISVTTPSVNQMVKTLEKKGLIVRQPGQPRTIEVLIPSDKIPVWRQKWKIKKTTKMVRVFIGDQDEAGSRRATPDPTPANLYVFTVFLSSGPVSPKYANKEISRVIEIRGDQTLDQLHQAIFEAFDRWEQHLYEFQFGERPFDPKGSRYGIVNPAHAEKNQHDARTTTLDDLKLKPERVFGYWFDFGDDWFHQIRVEKIERADTTIAYPRITKRKGKSPPQYREE